MPVSAEVLVVQGDTVSGEVEGLCCPASHYSNQLMLAFCV